jgi:tRNA dimethylallyltransferase
MAMSDSRRLVAIVGPTASGKSALGVWLARRLGGEILACDSTQVYRGFDIGTAKPAEDERGGIPHHLVDVVDAGEIFHAGEYRRRAIDVLDELAGRGKLPILTVGTGLYLRALLEGLCPAPARSEEMRERLRRRAEVRGPAYLPRILERLDPEAARRIGPRDEPKMIRAIEVRLLSGRPLSAHYREGRQPLEGYQAIKIGLMPPRQALYERIERRVDAMVEAGWIDEVRRLLSAGVPASAKPFQFIGYGEWREYLEGAIGKEESLERIRQATRRYAKRQITWFRREAGVLWLEGFGDDPAIAAAALAAVERSLKEESARAPGN